MGALFEALNERVLLAHSDLPCNFLQSKPSFMNIVYTMCVSPEVKELSKICNSLRNAATRRESILLRRGYFWNSDFGSYQSIHISRCQKMEFVPRMALPTFSGDMSKMSFPFHVSFYKNNLSCAIKISYVKA